jgi:hypothetical protein
VTADVDKVNFDLSRLLWSSLLHEAAPEVLEAEHSVGVLTDDVNRFRSIGNTQNENKSNENRSDDGRNRVSSNRTRKG